MRGVRKLLIKKKKISKENVHLLSNFLPCNPNSNMSKTEQSLNLPLIESFREAQEEEQTPLFSCFQNANASGS